MVFFSERSIFRSSSQSLLICPHAKKVPAMRLNVDSGSTLSGFSKTLVYKPADEASKSLLVPPAISSGPNRNAYTVLVSSSRVTAIEFRFLSLLLFLYSYERPLRLRLLNRRAMSFWTTSLLLKSAIFTAFCVLLYRVTSPTNETSAGYLKDIRRSSTLTSFRGLWWLSLFLVVAIRRDFTVCAPFMIDIFSQVSVLLDRSGVIFPATAVTPLLKYSKFDGSLRAVLIICLFVFESPTYSLIFIVNRAALLDWRISAKTPPPTSPM